MYDDDDDENDGNDINESKNETFELWDSRFLFIYSTNDCRI